jgi:peptide/nickel transport system permease protein
MRSHLSPHVALQRGALLLLGLAAIALLAPWLSPYAPEAQLDIIQLRSQAPTLAHPFGTDSFSRDVLSRVLHGGRISLAVAVTSVLISLGVGTAVGAMTALASPGIARLLRRVLEVLLSVPRLLVLLVITAVLGPLSVGGIVLLIGLTGWLVTARTVADALQGLITREFAMAARATGIRTPRLLLRHLLPHLVPVLVISATFGVANTIALEAGLSFLGLGIQPPTASWGTILHDGAGVVDTEWWLTVCPGFATVLAVLACNAMGDALRDRFAPEHVPVPTIRAV